jgi:hypothetical protein
MLLTLTHTGRRQADGCSIHAPCHRGSHRKVTLSTPRPRHSQAPYSHPSRCCCSHCYCRSSSTCLPCAIANIVSAQVCTGGMGRRLLYSGHLCCAVSQPIPRHPRQVACPRGCKGRPTCYPLPLADNLLHVSGYPIRPDLEYDVHVGTKRSFPSQTSTIPHLT